MVMFTVWTVEGTIVPVAQTDTFDGVEFFMDMFSVQATVPAGYVDLPSICQL